mmetsp:Transcript_192/g.660  ORF Transcript_192/g.660 Transcript_192/m.660 type:complete len:544 (-) Transcript_192:139-1770(-)
MLHDEGGLLGINDEAADNLARANTLGAVQISRWLIQQVDVGRSAQAKNDGDALQFTTRKLLKRLIEELLDLHRLDDLSLERRVAHRALDLLLEHCTHRKVELWANLLRLVRNGELRDRVLGRVFVLAVRPQESSNHTHKSRLARSVLAEKHHNLGLVEAAVLDVELENLLARLLRVERFAHCLVLEAVLELGRLAILLVEPLGDLEAELIVAKTQVLSGNEASQEDIDAVAHSERHRHHTVRTGGAVQAADEVTEVVQDRQIVLNRDHKHVRANVDERTDGERCLEALANIEVRRGLVEHVHVRLLHADNANREALQLTAGEYLDLTVKHVVEVKDAGHLRHNLLSAISLGGEDLAHLALHGARDVIDVLRLHDSLNVVFQNFGEIVLEFATAKVRQDLSPVRGVVVATKVRLELTSQHLERRALANTVRPDKTQDLSGPRHGQTVQLEAVRAIAVGGLLLQALGQIDDLDCSKRALLHADVAADAQLLRELSNLAGRDHFDANLAHAVDRASLLALLRALLRLALFRVHDAHAAKLLVGVLP